MCRGFACGYLRSEGRALQRGVIPEGRGALSHWALAAGTAEWCTVNVRYRLKTARSVLASLPIFPRHPSKRGDPFDLRGDRGKAIDVTAREAKRRAEVL